MSATIDFGIDLGTTNSSIAVARRGEVRVFQTTELMNVTPSVVYISRSGRTLVGKKAYDAWVQDPQNTQAEFKRWMGFNDRLPFPASGRDLSAEELSAEVLKSLRGDGQRQTSESIDSAVITVPAAFGSQQCDATGRAATLAGLDQFPLLQEPIAAAIAYGASPGARDQRWMVFDLGGGTLDIAVVSTRNSRLAVLEHQGNNRLGGKDMDLALAEKLLLPALAESYRLPDPAAGPEARRAHDRLMRALIRAAEQAKIALSTAEEATVDLFDLGNDADGKPMEASIPLRRADLEPCVAPIAEKCLDLARRALAGARLSSTDLDRVLLVGGPTQMPLIRSALESGLGAPLDGSMDPMTVVSHGAALFASTLNKTTASAALARAPKAPAGAELIELAFERASGSAQSPVAGALAPGSRVHEVRIDAAGGFWTSGWIPAAGGQFQVDVMLHDARPATRFDLSARDARGGAVRVTPAEFTIALMLPMAAPPLPHTMAIELSEAQSAGGFDPIFKRGCPLPAEARRTYKADRTLRPSEVDSTLPIKFWEIEVSDDPQEKWWAGCVHVRASKISRLLPEGSELELTIKIDESRKMSVELFIPLLNQAFSNDVYIPDPTSSRSRLETEMERCFERLARLRTSIYESEREDLAPRLQLLEEQAEAVAERAAESQQRGADPDAVLAPIEALRRLRVQMVQVEDQLDVGSAGRSLARRSRWKVRRVEEAISAYGGEADRRAFDKLEAQFERCAEADDVRGINWVIDQLWELRWPLVKERMQHWQERLAFLKMPGQRFLNKELAASLIAQADAANARSDLPALRSTCLSALNLLPPDQLDSAVEQEAQPGLRAT